jgi:hypothetical protein
MNIIRFVLDRRYREWATDRLKWRLRGFPPPVLIDTKTCGGSGVIFREWKISGDNPIIRVHIGFIGSGGSEPE